MLNLQVKEYLYTPTYAFMYTSYVFVPAIITIQSDVVVNKIVNLFNFKKARK